MDLFVLETNLRIEMNRLEELKAQTGDLAVTQQAGSAANLQRLQAAFRAKRQELDARKKRN
jgi:hypothetical protein